MWSIFFFFLVKCTYAVVTFDYETVLIHSLPWKSVCYTYFNLLRNIAFTTQMMMTWGFIISSLLENSLFALILGPPNLISRLFEWNSCFTSYHIRGCCIVVLCFQFQLKRLSTKHILSKETLLIKGNTAATLHNFKIHKIKRDQLLR